jgi:hypothetical protein
MGEPPLGSGFSNNHMLGDDLPPLEGEGDGEPERRRFLSGGRLVVAGVAVLALLGGGLALATGGGTGDDDDSGVATVDDDSAAASDTGSGDGDEPTADEVQDAMLEYAACMREHGIDMPDPEFHDDPDGGGGGGGVVMQGGSGGDTGDGTGPADRGEFEAADAECGEIMEEVRSEMPQMDPEEVAELQDKLLAMAECMRDRGYDFPDPEVSSDGAVSVQMGGPGESEGPDLDPTTAEGKQMQEDMSACNEEAGLDTPEGGPSSGPAVAVGSDT